MSPQLPTSMVRSPLARSLARRFATSPRQRRRAAAKSRPSRCSTPSTATMLVGAMTWGYLVVRTLRFLANLSEARTPRRTCTGQAGGYKGATEQSIDTPPSRITPGVQTTKLVRQRSAGPLEGWSCPTTPDPSSTPRRLGTLFSGWTACTGSSLRSTSGRQQRGASSSSSRPKARTSSRS